MKKKLWIIPVVLLGIIALVIGTYWTLRLGFQIDVLDRSGWFTAEDGTITYLDYYGEPLTCWQELEGHRYYFSPEGDMQTLWQDMDGNRYYLGTDGTLHTHWQTIDGNRYYFSPEGRMVTGLQTIDNSQYYFSDEGVLQTGFFSIEDTLSYADPEGKLFSGWLELEDRRYYCLENGAVVTGWTDIEPHRYYFNTDGTMYTGWLDYENDRYYLKENGVMAIGQVTLGETNHFFTSKGKYVLLVNHQTPVPSDYQAEIVNMENIQIGQTALTPLQEMQAAARAEGFSCTMTSGYRSFYSQQAIWDRNVRTNMYAGYNYETACYITSQTVMTPGHSEHQTGLAVDIDVYQNGLLPWLLENCWDYGFILRYPENKVDKTGISYEPWHYRYVGKELALELKELGLCMEEYMDMLTQQELQKEQ